MENDWDLQLSHQFNSPQQIIQNQQFEPDLLLQPITTQSKFNPKQNHKQTQNQITKQKVSNKKQIQWTMQQSNNKKPNQDKQALADQAQKFRQYLNEKVQELRKSKQQIDISQSSSPQMKSKVNPLRKIINRQQLKQKQNDKVKSKHSVQQPIKSTAKNKTTNIINKTSSQIKKNIQPSSSSIGKNENTKKQQNQKRFSNSHSNLVKNIQTKNPLSTVKKSLNLQQVINPHIKSPKLPNLTPKLNIPSNNHNKQQNSYQNDKIIQKRKNTIDSIHVKQDKQKQRRKTPQSKSSFRIKRTSNVNQSNQHPINVDIKKAKQVSLKTIQKQKQSPVHQGKNKKMRQQFMKYNQEQRKIQQQILKNHQQSKKAFDAVMKKYKLSTQAFQKYGIRKQKQFPNQQINSQKNLQKTPLKKQTKQSRIQKTSQTNIENQRQSQSPFKKQIKKNTFLDDQLEKINNLLKTRDKDIKKYQYKVEKNPFTQFVKQMPQDILQEEQQDEIDKVQQLPVQSGNKVQSRYQGKQFSSTYSSVMNEMKNKKWGLKQRITFQTHRQTSQSKIVHNKISQNNNNNKKVNQNSRLPVGQDIQEDTSDPHNKIQVNSRLRNLLLD